MEIPSPEDLWLDAQEFGRRSLRNLGIGAEAVGNHMAETATANSAAIPAGADATLKLMGGAELSDDEKTAFHSNPAMGFGTDAGGPGGAFMGTFAGTRAKSADLSRLLKAQNLERAGKDGEHIRQATNWFRGPDGEWRFEISDHNAMIRKDPRTGEEKLHHPEFRRAYPELYDELRIERQLMGEGQSGGYDPNTKTMYLGSHVNDPHQALSVLLHELQHPIQRAEGFSTGANPDMKAIRDISGKEIRQRTAKAQAVADEYRSAWDQWIQANGHRPEYARWTLARFQDEFDRLNPDLRDRAFAAGKELQHVTSQWGRESINHETYERTMGEYEAREVQRRMDMRPDERRKTAPYKHDQAIPQDRLIDMRQFDTQALIRRHLGLGDP